ncbi:hypothetical protein Ciccas_013130 [Cichlidogyrus casuarinus]|uniref:C2H2-type domain-containing protein n=1 Tax=Cichlidogyrus casuarinus TaxID=1844966 RepID=A0ABD2PLH9_9PLAT
MRWLGRLIGYSCVEKKADGEEANVKISLDPGKSEIMVRAIRALDKGEVLSAQFCMADEETVPKAEIVKKNKKCHFCGISFSNVDTLNAHIKAYCSKNAKEAPEKARSNSNNKAICDLLMELMETRLAMLSSKENNNQVMDSFEVNVNPSPSTSQTGKRSHSTAHYCKSCQRYFDSYQLYSSHVQMSKRVSEAHDNQRLQQLSKTAALFGLTLAAPLHTATGMQYLPVNPACAEEELDCQPAKKSQHDSGSEEKSDSFEMDSLATLSQILHNIANNSLQGSETSKSPESALRPYRCLKCQARFQSLHTFQVGAIVPLR